MEYIRKATNHDIQPVYKLLCSLEETKLNWELFYETYHENYCQPRVYYMVYVIEDNVVGFISLHIQSLLHHASKIAEIQELVVDTNFIGKNIGKKLFQEALKISRDHHCLQCEVCCNQKRTSSHQFYLSQGMSQHHYKFSIQL